MNKLFYFYGLDSETSGGKVSQRLLFCITALTLIIDVIFWISVIFFDQKIFHTSWAMKMVIRIISFVLYVSRHKRLIVCAKQISGDYLDKSLNRVSLVTLMVWCLAILSMIPSAIKWTTDEVEKDTLGIKDKRLALFVFITLNTFG